MDVENLITLEKRTHIISAIENATRFGGEIWQSDYAGREVLQIIQMHIDVKYDKIILRTNGLLSFQPHLPVFIRLRYRNLIFKLEPGQYKIISDKIICDYPTEAMGLKERVNERYVLPFNSDISLSIKRKIRNLRETVFELEVRIMDVSEFGFGLMISGVNRDLINEMDSCWIRAIDHKCLTYPISGKITYVAPKGYYLKKGEVRIGMALQTALNKEMFEYLKRNSRLVLTA